MGFLRFRKTVLEASNGCFRFREMVLEASNGCFRFRKMVLEASNGFSPVSEPTNRPDALVGRFLSSEAHHQLQHHLVLLRLLGDAAFGVEVFLVV